LRIGFTRSPAGSQQQAEHQGVRHHRHGLKVVPDAQVSSPPGLGSISPPAAGIPRAGQDLALLGAIGWADGAVALHLLDHAGARL